MVVREGKAGTRGGKIPNNVGSVLIGTGGNMAVKGGYLRTLNRPPPGLIAIFFEVIR